MLRTSLRTLSKFNMHYVRNASSSLTVRISTQAGQQTFRRRKAPGSEGQRPPCGDRIMRMRKEEALRRRADTN